MHSLTRRQAGAVAVALATMMILTRSHHFTTSAVLPSASWAVFFLAGLYLRSAPAFGGFVLLAAALDLAAIGWGGVSAFCASPAYPFLLPAYGSLWLAGRWYAQRHMPTAATLLPLLAGALAGSVLCELISSGGFYFFSGRFAEPSLAEFGERLLRYYPRALEAFGFWLAVAAASHTVIALATGRNAARGALRG